MRLKHLLLTLTLATGSACADVCYTLYDSDGNVIYGGQTPPFDLSTYSLELERSRGRGEHLVVNQVSACKDFEGRPEILEAKALEKESAKVFRAPSDSILPESLRAPTRDHAAGGDGFLGEMSRGGSSTRTDDRPAAAGATAGVGMMDTAPAAPGPRSGSVPSNTR